MGNRVSIRKRSSRRPVEERFMRPKRFILEPTDVDYKKLRKLILSEKLAPCFDGVEESNPDLEECPICFFYFPSLNRSRCCMKGICTECFLQMKPSNSNRPVQCPFCKYSIYAVEYHGARTQAEKRLEQEEEQKVIEAKIRMQVEESQEMNRETLADQILPGAEVQSPLPYVWQLPNHGGNDQDGRYTQLSFTPERAEAARASLYNNIHPPSKLAPGVDLYCFKHKIEPKWEDPICANGGKWSVTCNRGKADTLWLYTLLAMIGEQFDYGDEICGAVVNVRGKQEKIGLWTKTATNEAAQTSIGRQWKELLDYNETIGFIFHDEAKRLERSAKNRYSV